MTCTFVASPPLFLLLSSHLSLRCSVVEKDGQRVFIDPTSYELVDGSVLDYREELIRSSFRVIGNPNAELSCGCGTSFAPTEMN